MAESTVERAKDSEAGEVYELIDRCREAMKGTGSEQWPDFYPDLDVVRGDIQRGALWIYREGGAAVAAMTIDDIQPEPYAGIKWKFDWPYLCVHRLAVDPAKQNEGLAGRMMAFAEKKAMREGFAAIRLDTYGRNKAAKRFYESIGYRKRGTIRLPKKPGKYNCYEKKMQSSSHAEFHALVSMSRSVRRFKNYVLVSREMLERLVGLARLSPSGANRQPLKFLLSDDLERNDLIFPHLKWAGYLKDWRGPSNLQKPGAYIVILGDREISEDFGVDHGIAAQTMMLGAAAEGYGACIIGSIDRSGLAAALGLSDRYEVLLVLAIGYPAEAVEIEDVTDETGIRYWRSEDGVHHVPKRSLTDLIIEP